MKKTDLITEVFSNEGETKTVRQTLSELIEMLKKLNPSAPFAILKMKALGSFGDAISHGFIRYENGNYVCMRDAV